MNRARNVVKNRELGKVAAMGKMMLQLFAGNLNQNTTGDAGMTVEMKEFYEKTLITTVEPKLIFDQFGDKYPIPKNGGKVIEFRKYDSLPKNTTPLVEGVTPDGTKMNVTNIKAEVKQYGDYITLTDVLELTAIDNNVVQATKLSGSQAGRTLDTITRDIICGGTNVMFAPKSDGTEVLTRKTLDATCKLNIDIFLQAAAYLGSVDAQTIDDSYVAIIHPNAAYDVKSSDGFEEWNKYTTPEKMWKGEIGRIGNIRFIENSEAKIIKDSTCPSGLAVYQTMVIAAHAYGVTEVEGGGLQHIVKQLGSGEDPLNQRSTVGWKAIKTAERLVEQYMIRVESCGFKADTVKEN